jgi:hypothetical protein
MRLVPSRPSLTTVLMWLGLLGPAFAWTIQHVAGVGLTQGFCGVEAAPGSGGHLDAWTIAVTAGAVVVSLAGLVAALATWRRTRDVGTDPPGARIHFLSIVALTTTPLFLAIMLLSGISALFVTGCQQS